MDLRRSREESPQGVVPDRPRKPYIAGMADTAPTTAAKIDLPPTTVPGPGAPASATAAIETIRPESPMRDVMNGALRVQIPVLDHGFVALVDAMPRLVPEGRRRTRRSCRRRGCRTAKARSR